MSDVVIQVDSLWKKYRLGVLGTGTLRHDFNRWLHRIVGKPDPYAVVGQGVKAEKLKSETTAPVSESQRFSVSAFQHVSVPPSSLRDDEMWALRDISFEVKRGVILGIIGRNGAGKSTLLKILSRVTAPTSGEVRVKGRIASLLEVGTGFHPELTGRENIFLNGAILGMTKAEIKGKLDEIVAFSEVEKFIDTPVKRYSSGMYVRLAFAVAAHLEPEILIVDEVLAVGDAKFQKKCLGKMGQVAKQGRTVLFVSHNMQAVSTLTQQSIMLVQGQLACGGLTSDVISRYLREGRSERLIYANAPSSSEPRVTWVEVITSEANNIHAHGKSLEVRLQITAPERVKGASLSFQAINSMQQPVLHLWTFDSERPMCREAGVFDLVCKIPRARLYLGQYTLTVHFAEYSGGRKLQTIEGICPFEVVMYGQYREFKWEGGTCTYLEDCHWQVEMISAA